MNETLNPRPRMPHQVSLGEIIYTIFEHEDLVSDDGRNLYARICPAKQIIEIKRGLSGPRLRESLLHEIAHGLESENDLEDPDVLRVEEHRIILWSKAWLRLIRDNPVLVTWLQSDAL